jgi:hypothetical protein
MQSKIVEPDQELFADQQIEVVVAHTAEVRRARWQLAGWRILGTQVFLKGE